MAYGPGHSVCVCRFDTGDVYKRQAQELREYMAKLGIRTVEELVGRSDLLQVRDKLITHRAETLDLSGLLQNPYGDHVPHFDPKAVYDFHLETVSYTHLNVFCVDRDFSLCYK